MIFLVFAVLTPLLLIGGGILLVSATDNSPVYERASVIVVERRVPSLIRVATEPYGTTSIPYGGSLQFTAYLYDENNNFIDEDVHVIWSANARGNGTTFGHHGLTIISDGKHLLLKHLAGHLPSYAEIELIATWTGMDEQGVPRQIYDYIQISIGDPQPPIDASRVVITPNNNIHVVQGGTVQLSADAYNVLGFPIPSSQFNWSIEGNIHQYAIAIDGNSGLLTIGDDVPSETAFYVRAYLHDSPIHAQIPARVIERHRLSSIEIYPQEIRIVQGGESQFIATAILDGLPVHGFDFIWSIEGQGVDNVSIVEGLLRVGINVPTERGFYVVATVENRNVAEPTPTPTPAPSPTPTSPTLPPDTGGYDIIEIRIPTSYRHGQGGHIHFYGEAQFDSSTITWDSNYEIERGHRPESLESGEANGAEEINSWWFAGGALLFLIVGTVTFFIGKSMRDRSLYY